MTDAAVFSEAVAARRRTALARLMTLIENGDALADDGEAALGCAEPVAWVLGVTGAPGAGKSTLTSRLIGELRTQEQTVAVLAVDPSSPLTGGALLGDRIRMAEHVGDDGVFIRSMATRGSVGGLALAVPRAVRALAAFGFDWIVVETVGIGQVEVDVAGQTDTTIVVLSPGAGDHIQASKAGLMEVGDVFVVNKADRPGAEETRQDVRGALALCRSRERQPTIVSTVATDGAGVTAVLDEIRTHRAAATASGEAEHRRRVRRIRELRMLLRQRAAERIEAAFVDERRKALLDSVACGDVSAAEALTMFELQIA